MTIEQSAVLDERYRLGQELGHGGMADVYRAQDELLNRAVAVKVLREVADPALRARFVAEAKLLASLNHPGLVTLLDAGIRGDRPYLVMTLADGPTLAAQIAAGALPAQAVAELGTQLAEALAYAHEHDVVHRDVKPSNVLMCEDARTLLADFGVARLTGDLEQHTRTGETVGSPAYLAPEQAAGEAVTPAADIYSLGLVLLEALTGERAYAGTPLEVAVRRLNVAPEIPASLPRAWRDLLAAMTDRDPEARPTAAEVAAQLAGIAAGMPEPEPASADTDQDAATQTMQIPLLPGPDLSDLATSTQPVALGARPEPVRADSGAGRPRRWRWVLAALVAVALAGTVLALVVQRQPAQGSRPVTRVPTDVPSQFQAPLKKLHRAIDEASR